MVDGMQIGGIERVCIDYTNIFLELGYEVTLINLKPDLNSFENELSKKVTIHHVPFARRVTPEQYTQLIKRGILFKIAYPLIYIWLLLIDFIYLILCKMIFKVCREKFDIAIAFSSHFNDLTFVAGHFLNTKHKLAWVHGALYSYLLISDGYLNLYKKIKNLIVLVNDAQEEVISYNKDTHLNIYKVYNPSTIKKKKVQKSKVNDIRKKYGKFFLMVSRFQYPHKDQPTVIKAFNILVTKFKVDCSLLFIGDGPDRKKCEDIVNNLDSKVRNKIYFLGSKFDVQNYYSAAYALVHASVAGEGLPTVMIEAMNYQLPEVVTDSKTGPREILGDNEYGLLCKVQNPSDMAKKMDKILNNKGLYSFYQNKEKERVQAFVPSSIKLKIENALMEILKN